LAAHATSHEPVGVLNTHCSGGKVVIVGVADTRERVAVCVCVRVTVAVRLAVVVPDDDALAPREIDAVAAGVGDADTTHAVSVTAPAVPAAPEATDEASGANEPATKVTPALAFTQLLPPPPPLCMLSEPHAPPPPPNQPPPPPPPPARVGTYDQPQPPAPQPGSAAMAPPGVHTAVVWPPPRPPLLPLPAPAQAPGKHGVAQQPMPVYAGCTAAYAPAAA
jgi:hypothetical protein